MNKIMVVDDDQTFLKLIRSNLEIHDFQVLTATDPRNALDKMNGEECDLALVDLMLNGKSGLDLMENLQLIIGPALEAASSSAEPFDRSIARWVTWRRGLLPAVLPMLLWPRPYH